MLPRQSAPWRLQQEISQFNRSINSRMPLPLCIRCGMSAGEVALDETMPIGHLQSPVIDRAAALQERAQPGEIVVSSELAAHALVELGQISPYPELILDEQAFIYQSQM